MVIEMNLYWQTGKEGLRRLNITGGCDLNYLDDRAGMRIRGVSNCRSLRPRDIPNRNSWSDFDGGVVGNSLNAMVRV